MAAAAVGGVLAFALACTSDSFPTTARVTGGRALALAGEQVLVGAGDIASCDFTKDDLTANLLDSIPGTVFTLGDNVYPDGSAASFTSCYDPTWGRHKARTRPAPGNHDYDQPGASGYFGYFGAAAGDSTRGYYSYDLGAWHVIVLNSEVDISATSAQLQWLKADLTASQALCTVAMWHHPRFSSGTTHGSSTVFQPAWELLYAFGADLVLVGHEHNYERFAPQRPDGLADFQNGIREIVAGTGGATGDPFGPPIANSEVRNSSTSGVLKLTLDSASYTWNFIPIAGQTFSDSGTTACHGAPPNITPVPAPGGPYATSDGTVHFDGRSSGDPDGDVSLTYLWDFGDGSGNDGGHPSHTYTADGTFTARLTVTNLAGASGTATTTVAVNRTNTTVTFSGAGNIGTCTSTHDDQTALLLDSLPGFVFTTGNNAYPSGAAADYANCFHPQWGRQKTRTFPALGNHDYSQGNANDAFAYWGNRLGTNGQGYYSVDIGAWHVIVLNDGGSYNPAGPVPWGQGSVQEEWLEADLAATHQHCVMALWNVPLFLSSQTAGYTTNNSYKALWTPLYNAGADIVINGHQHDYERMAPMRPDGTRDDSAGIRQFNVGTGGADGVSMPTVIHPNSQALAAVFGVLKLTLHDGSYDWQFVGIPGQSFTDAGSGTCHHAVPLPNQLPVANAGGPYASASDTVVFDGRASSDPDSNYPLSYAWTFGDGASGTGAQPTHVYGANGSYNVALTVTDARGGVSPSSATTATITVPAPTVIFSGAANIASCNTNNAELTAEILDTLPGAVFTVGDNAFDHGTPTNYTNCYQPKWGRHLARTNPVLGNHDYDSSTSAAGAFGYYGARLPNGPNGWYSYDLGAWHIIVLNDNLPISAGSAQETWLKGDLAASTKRCTIAMWHQPRFFSSNIAGWTSQSAALALWNDLYAAGVEIVLNGHRYSYERMAPQRPDGTPDAAAGIRQFNVGTGGYALSIDSVAINPNSLTRAAVYGVLKLTLRDGGYDWQFIPVAGQTYTDSGSGTCH